MSNLWVQAMPWQVHPGEEEMAGHAKPVQEAGFAGFVHHPAYERAVSKMEPPFDHHLWNHVEPEPTDHDFEHFEEHGEFSPEHAQRHQKAYDSAIADRVAKDKPDHTDADLYHFQRNEARLPSTWQNHGTLGHVDLKSQPVFATQSHVNQAHINRYKSNPDDKSWWEQQTGGRRKSEYEGNKHPLFVTHQGRLHVIEGHHRVAAALQRGDSSIHGWHYDLDKHPIPSLMDRF